MLLYLESDLDSAYKIDCKERTKKEKPWIQREEFRGLYEELIEIYIQKAQDHIFVDITMDDLPSWVLGEVERTLRNDVEFIEEEK